MDETKQPGLQIAQIFLLSAHFAHGENFLTLPPDTRVEVQTQIDIKAGKTEDDKQGFVLVTVKSVDDAAAVYRFQLDMMSLIVKEEGSPNLDPGEYVTKSGAAMMIPFVREALASITGRGRFGPLWLKPLNVQALEIKTVSQSEETKPQPEGEK